MFSCDWLDVNYFIQCMGDDTEQQSNMRQPVTNILPEAPRKPKMKVKAAKVVKHLLNFLQIKPKRKCEDTEQLCIHSNTQDSFVYENQNVCSVPATPDFSEANKGDGSLSQSWSYYVHHPFNEATEFEESADIDGINYDESYFEDDYWQDYHDEWVPCRTLGLKTYSSRLLEPEKTPYGEFRRAVAMQDTPRRRYTSLPNILADRPVFSLDGDHGTEAMDVSSELDIDKFLTSHPPVALRIAFDNLLDDTHSNSVINSRNLIPFCPEFNEHLKRKNAVSEGNRTLHQSQNSSLSASEKSVSSFRTIQNSSTIGRDSFQSLPVSHQSADFEYSSESVLVSAVPSGYEVCTSDITSSGQHSSIEVCCPENTSKTQTASKKCRSAESGYSSGDSSPPCAGDSADILQQIKNKHPSESLKSQTNLPDKQMNVSETLQQSLSPKVKPNFVQANVYQRTTSSPMQVISTPSFMNNKLPMSTNFISPIRQTVETPKMWPSPASLNSRVKRNRHQRRKDIAKDFVHSRFADANSTDMFAAVSYEDDLLLKAAAELIVNRLQFKELHPYIIKEELIKYLRSYYKSEIKKLSNRNVHSVSDYRKITKEACDTFTADRLNVTSCYCELLTAVLASRHNMISVCEEFIFENRHYFVSSTDFFEAPPEVILMLLCNNQATIFGTVGFSMRCQGWEHELNKYLQRYIHKYWTGSAEIYQRVAAMFALIRVKTQTYANAPAQSVINPVSKQMSHIQNEPVPVLCKGTRMFRTRQAFYTTQGGIPETAHKLLNCVVDRKASDSPRLTSSQMKISGKYVKDTLELHRRRSVKVRGYSLLSDFSLSSEELSDDVRPKSRRNGCAGTSVGVDLRLTLSNPTFQYGTTV